MALTIGEKKRRSSCSRTVKDIYRIEKQSNLYAWGDAVDADFEVPCNT